MFECIAYWRGRTTWWVEADDPDEWTSHRIDWEKGQLETTHVIGDDEWASILIDIF